MREDKKIMERNPVLLYKALVVGVILLFIGMGVQPAIATVQPEEEIIDVEPKDYLFQTIIDIANNPEIKGLLEQHGNDLLKVDIDRRVYRKSFFRNPRLFFNILFTKPSMSVKYLNKCYNKGVEITNILGEDKVLEIIENVEITDTKLFDELNNIIINDEGLLVRLETLNEMNKEFYSDPPLKDTIICHIGILIVAYLYLRLWILSMLSDYLEGIFKEIAAFIDLMIKIPMFLRFSIFAVTGLIVGILGCFGFPPYIIN